MAAPPPATRRAPAQTLPPSSLEEVLATAHCAFLPMLSLHDARALRLVNRSFCAVVVAHPWDDASVEVLRLALWRKSFPQARAVKLRCKRVQPGDLAHLQGVASVDVSGCKLEVVGLTLAACAHLQAAVSLDLGSSSVGDTALVALANALYTQPFDHLETLCLSDNSINAAGFSALCGALRDGGAAKLVHLDASSNRLTDLGAESLACALKRIRLTTLKLARSGIGPAGLRTLVPALSSSSAQLRHLDLSRNDLGDSGVAAVANALPHWQQLRELHLAAVEMEDDGMVALCAAFHVSPCSLTVLDVTSNPFADEGTLALSGALNVLPQLTTLKFGDNRLVLDLYGSDVLVAACGSLPLLSRLHIADRTLRIDDPDGAEFEALGAMLRLTPSLTDLQVDGASTGAEVEYHLAEGLRHTPLLTSLGIGRCCLYASGMEVLATALSALPLLTSLDLNGCRLDSVEALRMLGVGLLATPRLTHLDVSSNSFQPDGCIILSAALRAVPRLAILRIGHNEIGATGAHAIAAGLIALPLLRELDIACASIENAGLLALVTVLPTLRQLRILHIPHNNITSVEPLAEALGSGGVFITELSLTGNLLDDDNARQLAESLAASRVSTLHAEGLDRLSEAGKQVLRQAGAACPYAGTFWVASSG